MPGQRPYFEFELDGEHQTIEADTWKMDGADIVFGKWVFDGPNRREEEIARFTGVDYKSINRIIP